MTIRNKLYLFYITFFALLAIFPVTTDYIIQTYLFLDIPLFAPFPSEIFKLIVIICGAIILSFFILHLCFRKNKTEKLEYICITIFRYNLAFVMIFIYGYAKIAYKQFELEEYKSPEYLASDNYKMTVLDDTQAVFRNFGIM